MLKADSAIVANTLVKASTTANKVTQIGTTDQPTKVIGVALDAAAANNDRIRVAPFQQQVTLKTDGSGTVAAGDQLILSASSAGRVRKAAVSTQPSIGRAFSAAAASSDATITAFLFAVNDFSAAFAVETDGSNNVLAQATWTAALLNTNGGGGGTGADGETHVGHYRLNGVGWGGRIQSGTELILGGIADGTFWTDIGIFCNIGGTSSRVARFAGGAQLQLKRLGLQLNRTPTAISYTVKATDTIVGVTDTSAPRTITLLAANAVPSGFIVFIEDESNGALSNNITISPTGGDTIQGSATIATNGGSRQYYSNGSNKWFEWSGL